MSAGFDIRLTEESRKLVDKLARAGQIDMRPTLRAIGVGYRKEVDLIFSHKQPRNEGLSWPPLSPRYAAWKAKNFPGMPILVRTGSLLASMTISGAPGNIEAISKTSAIFGSSVWYGVFHDSDAPRRGSLPRRNFSEPSQGRLAIWRDQISKDLVHNFEAAGIKVDGEVLE